MEVQTGDVVEIKRDEPWKHHIKPFLGIPLIVSEICYEGDHAILKTFDGIFVPSQEAGSVARIDFSDLIPADPRNIVKSRQK